MRERIERIPVRRCNYCGEIKPRTVAFFNRSSTVFDGLRNDCRPCHRVKVREYKARRKANGGKPLGQPKVTRTEQECSACGKVLPWDDANFYVVSRNADGSVKRRDHRCKPCSREHVRSYYHGSEAFRERKRQRRRERRQENPEAVREQERRHAAAYEQRHRNDKAARRRRLEDQRINRRIRAEQEGRTIAARAVEQGRDLGGLLPSWPLAEAVWPLIERRAIEKGLGVDEYADAIGVGIRRLRSWREREAETVQFDVLDRVLCVMGLLWFEVYDEERWPEAHEKARALFEGES